MNTNTTTQERKFRLTREERSSWDENGYFIRYNVFSGLRVFLRIGEMVVAQSLRLCPIRRKLTVCATNTELALEWLKICQM